MTWAAPAYEPLKMDAEIGSYNEDYEPTRELTAAEGACPTRHDRKTRDAAPSSIRPAA